MSRLSRLLLLWGMLLAPVAGAQVPSAVVVTNAPASPGIGVPSVPIENFTDPSSWINDSTTDYAQLSADARFSSAEAGALRISVADDGLGRATLRKQIDLDLTTAHALLLDIFNAQDAAIGVALGLHASDGTTWSLRPRRLKPGWNRSVAFSLAAEDFMPGQDLAHWPVACAQITQLGIDVLPQSGDCTLVVENLRCQASTGAVLRQDQARWQGPVVAPSQVDRFATATVETDVAFPPESWFSARTPEDPWLRRMTAVHARVRGPDNREWSVPGYCTGITAAAGTAVYHYRLQLPTDEAGVWRYQLGVTVGKDTIWKPDAAYVVGTTAVGHGPVGIDPRDRRWFSCADGSWFYPLGENVAWSGDYEPYAAAIARAGGNCMRVWICPWNNPLDVGGRLDVVNFAAAERIDQIFAIAARHGLVVQLCLGYHGALLDHWTSNPFNRRNGGTCSDPREFWCSSEAKEHFRRLLDYCLARWGGSSQLFAWELFNESDLTPRLNDSDIIGWHHEMADYLHAHDHWHHPVTTSVSTPLALPGLWTSADLDIAQVHLYNQHAGAALQLATAGVDGIPQPLMIGEWGRGWVSADNLPDAKGTAYREALWSGWMHGLPAAPWPWDWDTEVAPHHLLDQIAHLHVFLAGEDPRGTRWESRSFALPGDRRADCLWSEARIFGYVYAPSAVEHPNSVPLGPVLAAGHHLVLTGLAAGTWLLEPWDVVRGQPLASSTVHVGDDESAALPVPPLAGEFAFKLTRQHLVVPGMHVE